ILTTTLAYLALKTARMAGFERPVTKINDGVEKFLNLLAPDAESTYTRYSEVLAEAPDTSPYAYNRRPINEACWLICMLYSGKRDLKDAGVIARKKLLASEDNLPAWKRGKVDFLYWWLGANAMYSVGGGCWDKWEKAMGSA